MTRLVAALVGVITIGGTASVTSGALVLTQRQAYVMGTRVEMSAFGGNRADGAKALEMALASLEATDAELSTWKAHSDVSAINRSPIGQPMILQPRLCRLFVELNEWHAATGGTFDPGIGALTDAWGVHGGGRTPTDHELQTARTRSGLRLFDFEGRRCTVARHAEATIDVGAFGKGEALDRAAAVLNVSPWMIDLGGQVSVNGVPPGRAAWAVHIADPRDRGRSVMAVKLRSGSLSTSAGSERDHRIQGGRIGHILDPRTGAPAPYDGSVLVWHERGLVADILSTALYVMGPREGATWAESRGIAAAYLIPAPGGIRTVTTAAFARLEPTTEPE
jgi:thiamine biosynthesis lipoprotein